MAAERYLKPDPLTRRLFNPLLNLLMRFGISIYGSRILAVRGRKSGEWRTTPVNLLEYQGGQYLVAPRGVTQWVRNVRAGSEVELRLGSRKQQIHLHEIDDANKVDLLRAYLRKWRWEVGQFFQGVGPDASDDEIQAIAPLHPIFRIS
ncbi:MAG: nitroreductase family deazaflavin-dependent oxidoreductase [Chloroflexi bacterium]|nr:nitroreductase family deazaflavin-dependent oxidoreductase [Chloroflexota bacterium]